MSELYEKSLAKLELDKVLEMLAGAPGPRGKDCLPGPAAGQRSGDVKARLAETTAASDLSTRRSYRASEA